MNTSSEIESNSDTAKLPRERVERPAPPASARKYGWLSRLRSYFIFDLLIWLYTIVLGIFSLPSSLFDSSGRIQHGFARLWSRLIMKTIFSPVRVTGLEKIDQSKPQVYAVNHASALDIPLLYVYLPFQFRIVFKKELLSYPIVGWHLKRSGQVCINQQNPAASIGSIRSALKNARWTGQAIFAGGVLSCYQGAGGRRPSSAGWNL